MTTPLNVVSRAGVVVCLAVAIGALVSLGQSLTVSAHDPYMNSSMPAPGEPTLAEVRAATERFRDVKIALAEGYIRDPGNMCETAEMMGKPATLGGMGIHFFRPDMLGISGPPNPRVNGNGTHMDFRKPAILIYSRNTMARSNSSRSRTSSLLRPGKRPATTLLPRSMTWRMTSWRTIPPRQWTRRTCSSPTTTGTSGSTGQIQTVSSRPSIPR